MKSIGTIVLFLIVVTVLSTIFDYIIGFILAIRDRIKGRIHEIIIRQQRLWADRIIKKKNNS